MVLFVVGGDDDVAACQLRFMKISGCELLEIFCPLSIISFRSVPIFFFWYDLYGNQYLHTLFMSSYLCKQVDAVHNILSVQSRLLSKGFQPNGCCGSLLRRRCCYNFRCGRLETFVRIQKNASGKFIIYALGLGYFHLVHTFLILFSS